MKKHDAVAVILRRVGLTAVILIFLAMTGQAQYTPGSWPASFLDYTDSTGNYIQDISDQNPPETDVFYSTSTPSSVLVGADGTNAFFRFQLYADPYQANGRWSSFAWVVAISGPTGQGDPIGWVSVSASGSSLDVTVKDQTTEDLIYTYAKTNATPGAVRSLPAGTSGYYYFDFQVPMAAITSRIGVSASTPIRFFYGTSTSGGTINKDYMSGSAVSFLGLTTTTFNAVSNGTLIPLPVELTTFTAFMKGSEAQLRWKTATETNNVGFDILRSIDGAEWTEQGFVAGSGSSSVPRDYSWKEALDGRAGNVRYRLRQLDRDGSVEYHPIVELAHAAAQHAGISEVYPQPARDQVTVHYTSSDFQAVTLTLYDLAGRALHTTQDVSGIGSASNAQTLQLGDLPSGRYMLRMKHGSAVSYRQLMIAR